MHKQYIRVMENHKQKAQGTGPCVFCEKSVYEKLPKNKLYYFEHFSIKRFISLR